MCSVTDNEDKIIITISQEIGLKINYNPEIKYFTKKSISIISLCTYILTPTPSPKSIQYLCISYLISASSFFLFCVYNNSHHAVQLSADDEQNFKKFLQKNFKIKIFSAIFGISLKNTFIRGQTSQVLVQWFLRKHPIYDIFS